jgi:hypothetical protein
MEAKFVIEVCFEHIKNKKIKNRDAWEKVLYIWMVDMNVPPEKGCVHVYFTSTEDIRQMKYIKKDVFFFFFPSFVFLLSLVAFESMTSSEWMRCWFQVKKKTREKRKKESIVSYFECSMISHVLFIKKKSHLCSSFVLRYYVILCLLWVRISV